MKYKPLKASIGDILKISDTLSLRFEKIAEDLNPTWLEIPAESSTIEAEDGEYVAVTSDIWFVQENGHWRMMTQAEHLRVA